jgi:flagellar assembly factor FliW
VTAPAPVPASVRPAPPSGSVMGRERAVTGSGKGVAVGTAAPPLAVDLPELHLVRPLPGFGDLDRFVLVRLGDDDGRPGVVYELRSLQDPDVRFLVGVPTAFFPDYAFELDEVSAEELELQDASDALVLVVLTSGEDVASTTANLLAPVVLNARTRSAAQVILSGTDWPVRAPIG